VCAVAAFRAFKAFEQTLAASRSVWRYHTNPASPNLCENCDDFDSEVYEVEYPNDLLEMFPYGEFVSDDMFMPNMHPHCKCTVVRES
jgi:hypothetical protein